MEDIMNKKLLKSFIPRGLLREYQGIKMFNHRIALLEQEIKNKWLAEKRKDWSQKETIRLKEFQIYSQTGEDGILQYIFEQIGTTNKTFVEIGIEDGRQCNTANLSLNFGWKGLLIEGNKVYAERAKAYYSGKPVKVVQAFVTKENINELIKNSGIKGKIDLLSIDIDGNDYWVWNEIDSVRPRVVVIEYNSILGIEPITIPYNPKFERLKAHPGGFYYGASLAALEKLASSKGYILVGCNTWGFNAFFVQKKDANKIFNCVASEEADYLPNGEKETRRRFSLIKHMPFKRV